MYVPPYCMRVCTRQSLQWSQKVNHTLARTLCPPLQQMRLYSIYPKKKLKKKWIEKCRIDPFLSNLLRRYVIGRISEKCFSVSDEKAKREKTWPVPKFYSFYFNPKSQKSTRRKEWNGISGGNNVANNVTEDRVRSNRRQSIKACARTSIGKALMCTSARSSLEKSRESERTSRVEIHNNA